MAKALESIRFARDALAAGRVDLAIDSLEHAARLAPEDAHIALAHARTCLDAGRPASPLFEHAHRLDPHSLPSVEGWAAALLAEGDTASAERLLAETLVRHPAWLAGHAALYALRFTRGEGGDADRGYAAAWAAHPRELSLCLAWFGTAMQVRDWCRARAIIGEGERHLGPLPAFDAARAVIAGEAGDPAASEWFARTAQQGDPALRIAHLRHCLRTARVDAAEQLALGLLQDGWARSAWPYLSLIWRLRGDPRARWLDGSPPFIRTFDLGLSEHELAHLADVLRRLHTATAPLAEQSVRGGTQTESARPLFHRAEPEIRQLRDRVVTAVTTYINALPPPEIGHPLLGVPRGQFGFSGSWSVRLTATGHHVSHTHPRGWISSAFYVALPRSLGPPPAGWISFGSPPATLDLELAPYLRVEPKPGRLVLFPSTMWHETLPFAAGERLVVAFDVTPVESTATEPRQ